MLRDYQKRVLRWAMSTQHPALYLDMRLGKTLTTIRAVKLYAGVKWVMVVGPYSVLPGWRDELEMEGERIEQFTGTSARRREQLRALRVQASDGRTWVLWNMEGWRYNPEVAGWPWDVVILDEATFIKNPSASVSKYFTKYFRGAKHRWVLTGTPAPESDFDYVTQMLFLDRRNLYGSFWRFRAKFGKPDWFHNWVLNPDGKTELAHCLKRSAYFLTRADVRLNGAKIREKRYIELPPDVRKAYITMEQEFILEWDGRELDRTKSAGQRYQWLRGLCAGFVGEDFRSAHKLIELSSLLGGELSGDKAVVFCQRLRDVDLVMANLSLDGFRTDHIDGRRKHSDREAVRKRFQAGELDHVVIQPETVKFGTSFTAADVVVYFTSPEGALTREQSEDRTVDVSALDSVLTVDLICADTVEEDLVTGLLLKEARSQVLERIAKGLQRRCA